MGEGVAQGGHGGEWGGAPVFVVVMSAGVKAETEPVDGFDGVFVFSGLRQAEHAAPDSRRGAAFE